MTLPSILLGVMCSLLLGSLFHVWADGGGGRLLLYLALSLSGFAAGQFIGSRQNWMLLPVGTLDLGLASTGSLVLLGVGHWLSLLEPRRPRRDDHA